MIVFDQEGALPSPAHPRLTHTRACPPWSSGPPLLTYRSTHGEAQSPREAPPHPRDPTASN